MRKIYFIILILVVPFGLLAQDNTFTGASSLDWDTPSNWSTGNVPDPIVIQKIKIVSNCSIPSSNSTSYTFMEGSVLELDSGVTLTNNGVGGWIMNGTLAGDGTFVGSIQINGSIEPGPYGNILSCGDSLAYGGRSFETVQIGNQCWMAENLNVGTMLDGNLESHNNSILEKYCYNNDTANCNNYGGLYSWMEMMGHSSLTNQGICPSGWHIPTDEEWMILEGAVDSLYNYPDPIWQQTGFRGSNVCQKLKSTNGWTAGNGTDEFGFKALPAGMRDHDASGADFFNLGDIAHFWSSTDYFVAYAKERQLWGIFDNTYRGNEVGGMGYSVRCVKD